MTQIYFSQSRRLEAPDQCPGVAAVRWGMPSRSQTAGVSRCPCVAESREEKQAVS